MITGGRRTDMQRKSWQRMIRTLGGTLLCASLLAIAPPAWAVHPFQIEETDTQGTGNYLLEATGDWTKDSGVRTTLLTGTLTAGTGKDSDVFIEAPYLLLKPGPVAGRPVEGVGDATLGLKFRLFENEVRQSMGLTFYGIAPTGSADKGLGTGKTVAGFQLTDQQGCCDTIYRAGIGYESQTGDLRRRHFAEDFAVRFGLALEHSLTDSFRLQTELVGTIQRDSERGTDTHIDSRPFTLLAGVRYDLTRSWRLDLAVRAGLNKYAEHYHTIAVSAWTF